MPRGNPGIQKSDEHKQKISKALKAKGIKPPMGDKETRYEKTSKSLKVYYAIPENRAKLDNARRKRWDNPDNRMGGKNTVGTQGFWRQEAIKLYGERCQRCGSTDKIEMHHRDENPKNNTPENWEILCRSCHTKVHKRSLNWLRVILDKVWEGIEELGCLQEDKEYLYDSIERKLFNHYKKEWGKIA